MAHVAICSADASWSSKPVIDGEFVYSNIFSEEEDFHFGVESLCYVSLQAKGRQFDAEGLHHYMPKSILIGPSIQKERRLTSSDAH